MEKFLGPVKKICLSKKSKTSIREKLICCLKEKPLSECLSKTFAPPGKQKKLKNK